MTIEEIIVDECTRHGGPTDRCVRIYRALEGKGPTRRKYWNAVQRGINLHRWRTRRAQACGNT